MTVPRRIRILVIDRHDSVRRGLSTALATADDMEVIGSATSVREVVGGIGEAGPDIVLMDLTDVDPGSYEAVQWIAARFPDARLIAMATDLTPELQARAEDAGARATVHKFIPFDRLADLIRDVHSDSTAFSARHATLGKEREMGTSHMMHHRDTDEFSRETEGLSEAIATPVVDLGDGDTFSLVAAPVRKRMGGEDVRMLAYNGSVPGPTLRVRQDSTVTIDFTNQTDLESTIHWHGLRLDNRFDGTHATQAPVPVGGSFAYQVSFPDPGVYWYHPHIREDYGQEMGLAGNIIVEPAEPDYWSPANREIAIVLDDLLIEDGRIAAFSRSTTTHAAMGRFGNVLLANGEPNLGLTAKRGEVVRLYLTNTANTRVFNVGIDGARMKLVGGDSGRVEREAFVETVLLAPSERVVVDVCFDQPGTMMLEHRTPHRRYALATITVSAEPATPSLTEEFEVLRVNDDMVAERQRIAPYLDTTPDKTLAFVASMDLGVPEGDGPVVYACPMHPDVVQDEPGRCPICGMALVAQAAPTAYTCPMHPEIVSDTPGSCPICAMKLLPADLVSAAGHAHDHDHDQHEAHAQHGHHAMHEHHDTHGHLSHDEHEMHEHSGHHDAQQHAHDHHDHATSDGIEWEDDMVAVNRMTTPANTQWLLVDRETGAENHAVDWTFRVGDLVKIRLVNEMDSDHPMHHPFHVHGAGRFLILARNGTTETNLVWKDTVLVRTGETVDILLEVTNPGVWMAHCHIAEHHESGMMLHFTVTP